MIFFQEDYRIVCILQFTFSTTVDSSKCRDQTGFLIRKIYIDPSASCNKKCFDICFGVEIKIGVAK
jgi:hypothetical protein